ncbi:hypothetical protein ACFLQX_02010 [Bacteroidota bacterium]
MIKKYKHIITFIVLYGLLMSGGVLLFHYTSIPLDINTYGLTLSAIFLITLFTYILVMIGVSKGEKARGIYLLVGLGGKFILYLAFILIMWAPTKNLSKPFIIAFFVLYLILTFTLVKILYKALNTN